MDVNQHTAATTVPQILFDEARRALITARRTYDRTREMLEPVFSARSKAVKEILPVKWEWKAFHAQLERQYSKVEPHIVEVSSLEDIHKRHSYLGKEEKAELESLVVARRAAIEDVDRRLGYDELADADDLAFQRAWRAEKDLLTTPAPNLAAVRDKIELLWDKPHLGWDEIEEDWGKAILADVRRLIPAFNAPIEPCRPD